MSEHTISVPIGSSGVDGEGAVIELEAADVEAAAVGKLRSVGGCIHELHYRGGSNNLTWIRIHLIRIKASDYPNLNEYREVLESAAGHHHVTLYVNDVLNRIASVTVTTCRCKCAPGPR